MGGIAPLQLPLVLVQCDENTTTYNVRLVWEKVTAVTGHWTHHLRCQPCCETVTFGPKVVASCGPVILFLGEQI